MNWDENELLDFLRAQRDQWRGRNFTTEVEREAVDAFVDFVHDTIYEMGRDA